MKIEKITDNQIALFIDKNELIARNLKVSDLSYGNEKAKKLLYDALNAANTEVGFKADSPLSIEIVPLKDGDIKIFVSTIINPDELDARFSKFTPMKNEKLPITIMEMLESTIDKFEEALRVTSAPGIAEVNTQNKLEIEKQDEIVCIFEFDDIDKTADACKYVKTFDYKSEFYKDEKTGKYYLVLSIAGNQLKPILADFNKACNTLAEYGVRAESQYGINKAYFEEHYKTVIDENAVEKLAKL